MTSKESLFTFRVPDSSSPWRSRRRNPVSLDQKEKSARDFHACNLHVDCKLQSVHGGLRDKYVGSENLSLSFQAEISPIDRELIQINCERHPSARIPMSVA